MKRTELRRGAPLARGAGLARSALVPPRRQAPPPPRQQPRSTGPSPEVRRLVEQRHGGLCALCRRTRGTNVHHRKPRGAGRSTPARLARLNRPDNLLWLCGSGTTGCHGWIESHRTEAYAAGLLLRQHVTDPSAVPIYTPFGVLRLHVDGGHTEEPTCPF